MENIEDKINKFWEVRWVEHPVTKNVAAICACIFWKVQSDVKHLKYCRAQIAQCQSTRSKIGGACQVIEQHIFWCPGHEIEVDEKEVQDKLIESIKAYDLTGHKELERLIHECCRFRILTHVKGSQSTSSTYSTCYTCYTIITIYTWYTCWSCWGVQSLWCPWCLWCLCHCLYRLTFLTPSSLIMHVFVF